MRRTIAWGGTRAGSLFDRILASRFGVRAVELIEQGEFGRMVVLHGREVVARISTLRWLPSTGSTPAAIWFAPQSSWASCWGGEKDRGVRA
jgi:hypothetical protein